ncbi:hypothetical protein HDU98_002855, partial [Podochytrium sp. JEL0797]
MKSFTAVILVAIFSFGVSAQSTTDTAATVMSAPTATTTADIPAPTASNYAAPSAVNTNNLYSGASEMAAFGMATEAKFSQSSAVTRCRNVKETKLKAQHALAKLADEEGGKNSTLPHPSIPLPFYLAFTIYSANLDEARHQLRTQILEQTSVDLRQGEEAQDNQISWERKEQLNQLVEKLMAIKSLLRFQEEARERDVAFKSSIRQKRAAFQVRLARLEQRQTAERTELFQSQNRLADTVSQIRAIEINGIKDKNKARRMKRDNEIQAQQASMRQQK